MNVGRIFRNLTGKHGLREQRADELMHEYEADTAPQKREIAARASALERLVVQLERDTQWTSQSDSFRF